MPLVSDFRVVNDHARPLHVDQHVTFSVEIPTNVMHAAGSPQSVVYVKYGLEGASALKWEMSLNGRLLLWTVGSGSHIHMTMETFDANLLLPGENEFTFRVPTGVGLARISDATVHFHVNI